MYATIRHYTPKAGAVPKGGLADLRNRIESGYLPIVQDIPGFHGYYAVNVGDRELVTISIFENQAGATESTRRAAEFLQKDPLKDQLGRPEVREGELLVIKEAPVGAR